MEKSDWGPAVKCPNCKHIEVSVHRICSKCGKFFELLGNMIIARRVVSTTFWERIGCKASHYYEEHPTEKWGRE